MEENTPSLAEIVDGRFETEQLPFLTALVEQPSCSREPDDVEAAARQIDARFDRMGFAIERHADPSGVYAAHRVYTPPGLEERASAIALIGHVDTVFPRSAGFLGFRREGDVARGPGVLDMKSGLSAIVGAIEAIHALAPERAARLRVRVMVSSDEEVGSPSSAPLIEALAPRTLAALVFEHGRAADRIVTTRKGSGSFRVTVHGRAAHAGLAHEDGVNAIAALAHLIPRFEALTDYARLRTVNVGLVEGGTSANTVPALAWCTIDGRHADPADAALLEAGLRAAITAPLPARYAGARVELEGRFHRPPMVATESSRAWMERYAIEARAVGLGGGEAPLQGGGSDANLFAALGVPSIDGLGPAGGGAHQTSEHCSLESLRRRTVALARFLIAHAS